MSILRRILRPTCHRVQQVLQSYLDGELGDDDAAMVAAHLEVCDRCDIEADLYEQVKESLGALHVEPDPEVLARLLEFTDDIPAQQAQTGEPGTDEGPAPRA